MWRVKDHLIVTNNGLSDLQRPLSTVQGHQTRHLSIHGRRNQSSIIPNNAITSVTFTLSQHTVIVTVSVLCLPGWPLEVSLPLIVTFVRTSFPTSLSCSSLFIVFSCHHLPCLHLSLNTLVVSVIVTESLLNVTLCFPGSLVSRVSGCGLCFLCWTDYLDVDLCLDVF